MDDPARLEVRQRLELLIAAARDVSNRAQEALDTLNEGYPNDAYRTIYNANNLQPELAAVSESFRVAGISPSLRAHPRSGGGEG